MFIVDNFISVMVESGSVHAFLRLNKRLEETPGLTRDALAKEEGITPSFLTRILNLLKLAPYIQQYILDMKPIVHQTPINENRLRLVARNADHKRQIEEFERLKIIKPRARRKLRQPEIQDTSDLEINPAGSAPGLEPVPVG